MNEIDEFLLEHFGTKGMKWGVRKEQDLKGDSRGGSKEMSKKESDNKREQFKEYSKTLEQKYGKDSMKSGSSSKSEQSDDHRSLTSTQKKALIIGGTALGLVVAAGGIYGAVKLHNFRDMERAIGYMDEASNLDIFKNPGLVKNWDNPIHLPAGSIIQRMSTVKETDIKPDGFYGAFSKNDVEHYKAALPKFWGMWGYKEKSGYLTQIRANEAVKAPSGKETFDIYKKLVGTNENIDMGLKRYIRKPHKLTSKQRDKAATAIARANFNNFSTSWVSGDKSPEVKSFFNVLKGRGYNSVIDFNDSSRLADTPLRLLHGNQFKVTGHIPVSEGEIAKAQKTLGMTFDEAGGMFGDGIHFLHSADIDVFILKHYNIRIENVLKSRYREVIHLAGSR